MKSSANVDQVRVPPFPWRLGSEQRTLILFLAPALVFLFAVVIYPLATTLWGSLFEESLVRPAAGGRFVGLSNYGLVLGDASFWATLGRTVVWTVGSVLGKTLIGLALALLLNGSFRGNGIYRVLLLIPWATPQVIGAIVWKWLYNSENGYLNYLLLMLGVVDERVSFLGSPSTALLSTMIVDMWFGIPFMAIVMLAGLQSIPRELYEAVAVDGATSWRRFRDITLPLLTPVLGVATNLSVVWTFNSFNIIQTLTRGGPVRATEILVIHAYKEAFGRYDVGVSSTYSAIIFLILMAFSLVYWRVLRKGGEV
ncbi:carbohydrate ABC transporter permease [Limnochorda pilosa]|uniref:Sugar ABC transporter permease n=1 Tax=Limnochorda pilosa TaxID=1555112 RepID=A0A0K2SL39_LIMPI|nr:sugar ABC transporter permease [Limnochorda pilosa]BAS27836.1 sugar ABC transporter permease [Limnochorda pilosa]